LLHGDASLGTQDREHTLDTGLTESA